MDDKIANYNETLTSTEIGKLWATYTGNTMAKCVISYYLKHIEDEDIKQVLETALNLSETIVEKIREIFIKENFPIPIGFTEEDVNLGAPRLFSDEFYLHYLKYTCKAGMSIYSIAIPLMIRKDIREFFITTLNSTIKLITDINDTLEDKGFLVKPPFIPIPQKVDFVKRKKYLNGFFGNVRPLHALEIAHIYDNIENNVTSKGLLIGFSQVAKTEKIQGFLLRGKELTNKHIEICSQQIHQENLPSPSLLDDLVSTSTSSPFSEKLMLWHKIDMFSMKIRTYANGASLNGRRDIGGMYAKLLMDVALYVEDGAQIMIDQGWMEQAPEAADREKLAKK
ncbi:DUF3231 family protein [Bacillus sp. DTU_2020_1000418_1_SI_GHA_SEK_038]|uniref:DUF3231 family protein n=1 Tax=Bacillus sp. DTU_2020_1000418_1_SI_GHA_SEK_038 TaxID=3077585 RepID=UPI0028E5F1B0|nr:DUF3231 family protein [Bacillus sp. DTU_2020_1000418_1_SI_GHA_SEK_038]WNS76677.1 DUF3231 family protein [Bacillus sp. DTU_2020_1000418_1_SI_GHA_SEK_038]